MGSVISGTGQLSKTSSETTEAQGAPIIQRVNIKGDPGDPGVDAFTKTTDFFAMPPADNTTPVVVTVEDGAWISIGQALFIETAGYMNVTASTSLTVTVVNPGVAGNAGPTTVIAAGKKVSPSGIAGPTTGGGVSSPYSPAIPGDWNSQPSTIQAALDLIAAAGTAASIAPNIAYTPGVSWPGTPPADAQDAFDSLAASVTSLFAQGVTLTSGIATLTSNLATTDSNLSSVSSQVITNTNDIVTDEANITALQGDVTTLQGDVTSIDSTLSTIYDYSPAVPGNWTSVPSTIQTALDDIASGGSKATPTAATLVYSPGVPGNWSPAPTDVGPALDQLAARPSGGGGATLPIVFQPSGTAETNVFLTESTLNTAIAASFGPQTVFFDFSHTGSNEYTTTASINFSGTSAYQILGRYDNSASFLPPALVLANQLVFGSAIFPIEIRDVTLITTTVTPAMSSTTYLILSGRSKTQANNSAVLVNTSGTIELRDYAVLTQCNFTTGGLVIARGSSVIGDGPGNKVYNLSTGSVSIELHDNATLMFGAVVLSGAAVMNIYIYGPGVTLDSSYIGMSGVTIHYMTSSSLLGYTPAVAGNWSPTPTLTSTALDQLATRTAVKGVSATQALGVSFHGTFTISAADSACQVIPFTGSFSNSIASILNLTSVTASFSKTFDLSQVALSIGATFGAAVSVSVNGGSATQFPVTTGGNQVFQVYWSGSGAPTIVPQPLTGPVVFYTNGNVPPAQPPLYFFAIYNSGYADELDDSSKLMLQFSTGALHALTGGYDQEAGFHASTWPSH